MNNFEFVSHHYFPDDQYNKELVYLQFDGKYRVAYIRKSTTNGGLYWSVPSVGVSLNGTKKYYETFIQDSNFLEKDIKNFLESRVWEEKRVNPNASPSIFNYTESHVISSRSNSKEEETPF